jgi:nucleotide-binding universal stress UspA family protein
LRVDLRACKCGEYGCPFLSLLDDAADAATAFGKIARSYDLAVVAQPEQRQGLVETLMIEAALFDSGRPVLVVPYIHTDGIRLDRIVVCWDEGRNAARAVGDALPLLIRGKCVDVVTVEQKEQSDGLRGARIVDHLGWHGLNVSLQPIVAPDSEVANVILSYAADHGVDLIVMGAYGHSRFREFVLGGATRGMLTSMTVPVLMSH